RRRDRRSLGVRARSTGSRQEKRIRRSPTDSAARRVHLVLPPFRVFRRSPSMLPSPAVNVKFPVELSQGSRCSQGARVGARRSRASLLQREIEARLAALVSLPQGTRSFPRQR